jgi:hypothetical protein
MIAQRQIVHDGSAISKALDYSLKRWAALSRYLDDGAVASFKIPFQRRPQQDPPGAMTVTLIDSGRPCAAA